MISPCGLAHHCEGAIVQEEVVATIKKDQEVTQHNCDTTPHLLIGSGCSVVKVLGSILQDFLNKHRKHLKKGNHVREKLEFDPPYVGPTKHKESTYRTC
jgi:hypothetical protein